MPMTSRGCGHSFCTYSGEMYFRNISSRVVDRSILGRQRIQKRGLIRSEETWVIRNKVISLSYFQFTVLDMLLMQRLEQWDVLGM